MKAFYGIIQYIEWDYTMERVIPILRVSDSLGIPKSPVK